MELTKEYLDQKFEEQKNLFVTKEYFEEKFITKEYLDQKMAEKIEDFARIVAKSFEGVVTKEDLKQCATKEDLKNLATKEDLKQVVGRLDKVEERLGKVESAMTTTMVTKDFLTTKLYDLRGDLVVMMRKEDTKVQALIEILHKKNILQEHDLSYLLSLEPFASAGNFSSQQ